MQATAPATAGTTRYPPPDPDAIRVGAVSYLNTLPLIEGLSRGTGAVLTLAAPSHLLPMLESGQIDLALAPVIDAQRAACPVELIPAGGIGCEGATMSVRLYSTKPFEHVTRLHADIDSHTSVALAKWILHERFGTTPEMVEFDARERVETTGTPVEWPAAMLMIGDKVVTDSPPAVRYPHQIDLGDAWRTLTGLPFVYAVWMRPVTPLDPERAARVEAFVRVLDRQRRFNATRLDWIVSTHAAARRWPADLAREYLGSCLRYDITERQVVAIERFFDEAASLGLIERRPTRWANHWAPPPASAIQGPGPCPA